MFLSLRRLLRLKGCPTSNDHEQTTLQHLDGPRVLRCYPALDCRVPDLQRKMLAEVAAFLEGSLPLSTQPLFPRQRLLTSILGNVQ